MFVRLMAGFFLGVNLYWLGYDYKTFTYWLSFLIVSLIIEVSDYFIRKYGKEKED